MKTLLNKLDPYHQSPFFFRWEFFSIIFFIGAVSWLCAHARSALCKALLDNIFVYLPNYLIHEFSHRFWCTFGTTGFWGWWCFASGNGMETLIPLILCLLVLRLSGGRYLLPPLLYWLSTTLYGAGIYAADARAKTLPLTSSDMLTKISPGTAGDWHYILEPLGLLKCDVIIGNILLFFAMVALVLSIWSLFYYWTHAEQYIYQERWD